MISAQHNDSKNSALSLSVYHLPDLTKQYKTKPSKLPASHHGAKCNMDIMYFQSSTTGFDE